MSTYFISPDGQTQEGPLSIEQLRARFAQGQLAPGTLAWREGLANWSPIADIPELRELMPAAAQTSVAQTTVAQVTVTQVTAAQVLAQPAPEPAQPFKTFAPPQHPGPIINPIHQGQTDGLSIASLILGCISIVASCTHVFSLPFSITGLVLGCMSKTKTGVRTAGIITSSIGMGIGVIWLIVIILVSVFGNP